MTSDTNIILKRLDDIEQKLNLLSKILNVPFEESDSVHGHDPLFAQAVELVKAQDRVSHSFIQRRLRVGYARAAKILNELSEARHVSFEPSTGIYAVKK